MNKQTMLHDDIGDLVKFKKNLRWRKWPEEKPEDLTECLVIDTIEALHVCTFRLDLMLLPEGGFESDTWVIPATHWMPVSALPKSEDTK